MIQVCCCVPCLLSAVVSLCLMILHRRSRPHSVSDESIHFETYILICVCLYVEPVSRSKDYVSSRIKIGSVVCLYTSASPSVPEMEVIPQEGILFSSSSFFSFVVLFCLFCFETSVRSASALLSLQKLWFMDTVL